MKHAGPVALGVLGPLLAALRGRSGLVERKPGIFYRKGQAFAHFHEDAAGLFGDLKIAGGWRRLEVSGAAGRAAFLRAVDEALEEPGIGRV